MALGGLLRALRGARRLPWEEGVSRFPLVPVERPAVVRVGSGENVFSADLRRLPPFSVAQRLELPAGPARRGPFGDVPFVPEVGGPVVPMVRVPWGSYSGGLDERVAAPFVEGGVLFRDPRRLMFEERRRVPGRGDVRYERFGSPTAFVRQSLERVGLDPVSGRGGGLSDEAADRLRAAVLGVLDRRSRGFYSLTENARESSRVGGAASGWAWDAGHVVDNFVLSRLLDDIAAETGVNPGGLSPLSARDIGRTLDVLRNSQHTVTMQPRGFQRFLGSGRIRNAFETGISDAGGGGVRLGARPVNPMYLENRANREFLFGVPRSAGGDVRPTYGWRSVTEDVARDLPWVRPGHVADSAYAWNYGPIQLRFGPSVDERSAFALADTLDIMPTSMHRYPLLPRPYSGASAEDVVLAGQQYSGSAPYIESQVWGGGPRVDELESIRAYQEVAPQVLEWLRRAGVDVPVEVVEGSFPGAAGIIY